MTVGEALRRAMVRLRAAGVEGAGLDARLLLAHAAGLDQAALLRERDRAVGTLVDEAAFEALLERRAGREPLALIVGRQGFWSMEFAVSGETLVPRADSETLIEAAVAARAPGAVRRVLDLGTGTGCLLLAALTAFPDAWGLGVDCAPGAVRLARRNAAALGLGGRAGFVCGDWGAAVGGGFDLVLSNPPYVAAGEIGGLMPEVARFEPRRALDGGVEGLDAYRALVPAWPGLLAPAGVAVLELGAGQAEAVGGLARAAGFGVGVRADLGGVARAMVLELELEAGERCAGLRRAGVGSGAGGD